MKTVEHKDKALEIYDVVAQSYINDEYQGIQLHYETSIGFGNIELFSKTPQNISYHLEDHHTNNWKIDSEYMTDEFVKEIVNFWLEKALKNSKNEDKDSETLSLLEKETPSPCLNSNEETKKRYIEECSRNLARIFEVYLEYMPASTKEEKEELTKKINYYKGKQVLYNEVFEKVISQLFNEGYRLHVTPCLVSTYNFIDKEENKVLQIRYQCNASRLGIKEVTDINEAVNKILDMVKSEVKVKKDDAIIFYLPIYEFKDGDKMELQTSYKVLHLKDYCKES